MRSFFFLFTDKVYPKSCLFAGLQNRNHVFFQSLHDEIHWKSVFDVFFAHLLSVPILSIEKFSFHVCFSSFNLNTRHVCSLSTPIHALFHWNCDKTEHKVVIFMQNNHIYDFVEWSRSTFVQFNSFIRIAFCVHKNSSRLRFQFKFMCAFATHTARTVHYVLFMYSIA